MLLALYLIEKGMTDSFLFFALIVVWGYLAGILTVWFVYKESKNANGRNLIG